MAEGPPPPSAVSEGLSCWGLHKGLSPWTKEKTGDARQLGCHQPEKTEGCVP